MSRRWHSAGAFSLAGALLLSACGGGSEPPVDNSEIRAAIEQMVADDSAPAGDQSETENSVTTTTATTKDQPLPCATPGQDLSFRDLSDADLSGRDDLSCADFTRTNLKGANLADTDLSGGIFVSADLREANLSGADLTHSWIAESDFSESQLSGAIFDESFFWSTRFYGLQSTAGLSLRNATSDPSRFEAYGAQLARMNPSGGPGNKLDGESIRALTPEEVTDLWPALVWFSAKDGDDLSADVTGLHGNYLAFKGKTLDLSSDGMGFSCAQCEFHGVISGEFAFGDYPDSSFIGTLDLSLAGADLTDAYFGISEIRSCSFAGARFAEATATSGLTDDGDIWACDFTGADLSNANMGGTDFTGANFTSVRNGDSANWNGATCADGSSPKDNLGSCV